MILIKSSDKKELMETQKGISEIRKTFEKLMNEELNLYPIAAPIFVEKSSGFQDNLNGVERPITFDVKTIPCKKFEIVQSLAKWKRYALMRFGFDVGEGIYTDMKALRPDEDDLSSKIHSVFVEQWDWEKVVTYDQRNLEFLKSEVKKIYSIIKKTQRELVKMDVQGKLEAFLPDEIHFVHTEDLEKLYPELTSKEREREIAKKYGAVFVIGIGGKLSDGKPHDGRSPDYDDWSSKTIEGYQGLNGDIVVWNPILEQQFELSSMGIRVDKFALLRQLKLTGEEERLKQDWHKLLMDDKLPLSIGGGIGQSRLYMLLLQKEHIGEVQASVWPEYSQSTKESLLVQNI